MCKKGYGQVYTTFECLVSISLHRPLYCACCLSPDFTLNKMFQT